MIARFTIPWHHKGDGSIHEGALYAALQWIAAGNQRLAETLHADQGLPRFSTYIDGQRLHLVSCDDEVYAALVRGTGLQPVPRDAGSYQGITRQTIRLQFLTPTAFRLKGAYNCLPIPHLVFGSLQRRWNQCFPKHPIDFPVMDGWSTVRCCIETRNIVYRSATFFGFVGEIVYRIPTPFQEQCHILSRFASDVGVGCKTAQGWGVIRYG